MIEPIVAVSSPAANERVPYYGPYAFDQRTCPRCASTNVAYGGTSSTLVGWLGGPEENPNHHQQVGKCTDCQCVFVRHWVVRSKNTWCTIEGIREGDGYTTAFGHYFPFRYTIAGMPSCCVSAYVVHCPCGGWRRSQQQGRMIRYETSDGKRICSPPDAWDCDKCGYSGDMKTVKEA
jgi:hypothetical protein